MNKIKKRALLLLLASSLLLSGCDVISVQEYDKLENISADFGAVDSSTVFTGGESTNIQASEPVETNIISVEPQVTTSLKSETENQNSESYLPPNMSMDDLLNMIQIDGKTLSMPTTLEDILALNDDFTCEMAFSDLYSTPEKCIENMGGVFYDVKYMDEKLFQIVILKNDYNGDYLTSKIYKFSSLFNYKDFKKNNLKFNIINGIGFDCSFDEVIKIFGEPNAHTNATNSYAYKFYDKKIIYRIEFLYYLDEKGNESDYKHICLINIQTERI